MRWQQWLRWVFAAAGISFAVLLYLRFDRKPATPQAALPPALPSGVSYQSKMSPGGKQCRFDNGKEVSCVSYDRFLQMTDGRRVIEGVKFEGDRGGKPFIVSADRGELKAATPNAEPNEIPNETHLIGHVVMHEQDGMEINTDDANYTESTATLVIPGPLTFHRDRLTGGGVGASYVRGDQVLKINDKANVKLAPDEKGQGKLDGQSASMELNRTLHSLAMNGGAVIVRDEETIRTDVALMHLTDNEQGIAVMQMRGRSSVVPLAANSNTPEMHGDDIDLEFHPDGRTISRAMMKQAAQLSLAGAQGRQQITADRLDVQLAPDGHTVKQLTGTSTAAASFVQVSLPQTADTPSRVIKSRILNASGTEKDGLTAATFQDAVDFTEKRTAARGQTAPADRNIQSSSLTLTLNGGSLGDIKDARFRDSREQQVRFKNGATTSGKADDVMYLAAAGRLQLRPGTQKRRSSVDAEKIKVEARNIDIELEHTAIAADGDVKTETKPDKDGKARGLFDDTKAVNGFAAKLAYDDASHLATYDTGAWLRQGTTRIQADKIIVNDTAGDLSADGNVVTYLPMDNVATEGDPPKATAAQLRYVDATHRAVYTGTAKEQAQFNGPDGLVKAATIQLTLAAEGHELSTLVADGTEKAPIAARVSTEQTARGVHLDYDVKAGRYILDGNAQLIQKKTDNGVDSCSRTVGATIHFTKPTDGKAKEVTIGQTGTATQTQSLKTCQDWTIK
jgi:lipopolysaccharide export system protein LptA